MGALALTAPASGTFTQGVLDNFGAAAAAAAQPVAAAGQSTAGIRFVRGDDGTPITSRHRRSWLAARRNGVTATDARRLVRRDGTLSRQRPAVLAAKLTGYEGPRLRAFEHGIAREPVIAAWVAQRFGIAHNHHLCAGANPRHLATPDGVGERSIAEIKTSVESLDRAVVTYRDQLQWQLHVTGCEQVLLVVENTHTLRRDFRWIGRDERRIGVLVEHANAFLADLDMHRALAEPSNDLH